jgi:hypothetical protein
MGLSTPFNKFIKASATIDVASLDDGVGQVSAVTVTGAALGDFVIASCNLDLQGMMINAHVNAANTVEIIVQNETGGTIDLASTTFNLLVFK